MNIWKNYQKKILERNTRKKEGTTAKKVRNVKK